jgi:hypothetical protein
MQKTRSIIGRKFVALVVALILAAAGVPVAASQEQATQRVPVAMPEALAMATGSSVAQQSSLIDLEKIRREAYEQQNNTNPKIASRARRALLWYEILTARTRSDRHESVRKLPVTVVRSSLPGGVDTMIRFVVNGKTRIEWIASKKPAADQTAGHLSGPSDESMTQEECYDGPGPCISAEEMDDLGIALADTQAYVESVQAEYGIEYDSYVAYCNENPWACGQAPLPFEIAGPSAAGPGFRVNCWAQAAVATVGVASAIASVVILHGTVQTAVAAGFTLTVAGSVAVYTAAFSAGFFAGYYAGTAVACFVNRFALDVGFQWFREPCEAPAAFSFR